MVSQRILPIQKPKTSGEAATRIQQTRTKVLARTGTSAFVSPPLEKKPFSWQSVMGTLAGLNRWLNDEDDNGHDGHGILLLQKKTAYIYTHYNLMAHTFPQVLEIVLPFPFQVTIFPKPSMPNLLGRVESAIPKKKKTWYSNKTHLNFHDPTFSRRFVRNKQKSLVSELRIRKKIPWLIARYTKLQVSASTSGGHRQRIIPSWSILRLWIWRNRVHAIGN